MVSSTPRTALVQGASRGLGLAFVEALLASPGVGQVLATARDPEASRLADLRAAQPDRLVTLPLDVTREDTIARAAAESRERAGRLHLLLNCSGVLHDDARVQPEKRLERVDPEMLRRVFEVNAFGPLLVAKHFLPLLQHEDRSVLGNLSARVGSIGDDRLGGWYGYRGSKAAQNLFTRNLSIELARRAPRCICVALHPGTVATDLSHPFRRPGSARTVFTPEQAAAQLLGVIDALEEGDSGRFLAWDGSEIPW